MSEYLCNYPIYLCKVLHANWDEELWFHDNSSGYLA